MLYKLCCVTEKNEQPGKEVRDDDVNDVVNKGEEKEEKIRQAVDSLKEKPKWKT